MNNAELLQKLVKDQQMSQEFRLRTLQLMTEFLTEKKLWGKLSDWLQKKSIAVLVPKPWAKPVKKHFWHCSVGELKVARPRSGKKEGT